MNWNDDVMMNVKYFLLIVVCATLSLPLKCQTLHHQMLSAQGASVQLPSGMRISQTVGQVASIGTLSDYYSKNKGIQGFQQPMYWNIQNGAELDVIKMVVYPNPFVNTIQFKIPNYSENTDYQLTIKDLNGRDLYKLNQLAQSENVSLDLGQLPVAVYILSFQYKNRIYSSTLIKE